MSLSYFDDRCDELLQECVFQEGRPVVVEEVDEQTFDVGAVLILEAVTKSHNTGFFFTTRDSEAVRESVKQVT